MEVKPRESISSNASASNTSTTSEASSPAKSLAYEELKEPVPARGATAIANLPTVKMQYLAVRRLSDDEFSEADSMTR